MAKNIVAKLKGIKERDVKNSDWDNRDGYRIRLL